MTGAPEQFQPFDWPPAQALARNGPNSAPMWGSPTSAGSWLMLLACSRSCRKPGKTQDSLCRRAAKKVAMHALRELGGYDFTLLVVEWNGRRCSATHTLLKNLGRRAAESGRVTKGAWVEGVLRRLRVALCKGNDFLFRANLPALYRAAGKHPTRGAVVPHTIEVYTCVVSRTHNPPPLPSCPAPEASSIPSRPLPILSATPLLPLSPLIDASHLLHRPAPPFSLRSFLAVFTGGATLGLAFPRPAGPCAPAGGCSLLLQSRRCQLFLMCTVPLISCCVTIPCLCCWGFGAFLR